MYWEENNGGLEGPLSDDSVFLPTLPTSFLSGVLSSVRSNIAYPGATRHDTTIVVLLPVPPLATGKREAGSVIGWWC